MPAIAVMSVLCLPGHAAEAGQEQPVPKARLDQQGDALPDGAIARLGTARWRLREKPVTFAPNGRYAVVAGEPTRLFDAVTGAPLRVFATPSYTAFFAGDNKTVILPHWGVIRFLDIESGKVTREIEVKGMAVAWSADGKRLVCMNQDTSVSDRWSSGVWDLDRGVELCHWDMPLQKCALSADGSLLAVRETSEIVVYRIPDKKPLCQWRSQLPANGGYTQDAHVLLFLPDAKTLVATEGKRVVLWDATTGKLRPKGKLRPALETTDEEPVTLAASADGRYLAAGGAKGTLYLWDLQADALLHTIAGAGNGLPIYNLDFTPDGKRLVSQAHLFRAARVWEVASGKERSPTGAAGSSMDTVAFSPDGKALATLGQWDGVLLWDTASGKLLHRFEPGDSFAFPPDGKALATTRGYEAALWSVPGGKLRRRLKSPVPERLPDEGPWPVAWTSCWPDDNTLVAFFRGDVRQVVPRKRRGPDLKLYWTMVGIADAQTREVRRSFRARADVLRQFCLSPDGQLLAAVGRPHDRTDDSDSVLVWDLHRGVELFHADFAPGRGCEHLAFSADGRIVLSTFRMTSIDKYEHGFWVIEVATGKPRASLTQDLDPNTHDYSRGAIAGDGLAAVVKGPAISLFDPLTGKEFGRLPGHYQRTLCLAFSPDGKRLACAGEDTTALIWDVAGLAPAQATARLAEGELPKLWDQLLSTNAEAAFRALRQLVQAPDQTVAYLGKQLRPAPPIPEGRIKALVAQLDSESFDEREQAGRELLRLPELAEPALAEARKSPPSAEAGRRIEALLAELREVEAKGPWTLSGEPLREWRAAEVLERIGTPEAKRLLKRLAKGAPHAVLTRQAEAAAQRLTKRTGQP